MGQKIHPYGLRLGIVTDWKSRWYSEKDYAFQVNQDHQIRKYLTGELRRGAVSRIDIERIGTNKVQVDVHTGRPGVVIGRGGSEAERLRSGLEKLTDRIVKFNVIEVQNVELDATLLARSVADQLEGRVSFRRAMKRAVATALKAGAEGVRVQASGRLGGADMGRREWYLEGRVPLHTLRADIDYGKATARTTVGAIGVQVWVYKGDLLPSAASSREKIAAEARLAAGGPAKRRRSAKSRAEAAAGESGPRLIEAGGGKRIVEAGGGKRGGGRRLIEAGGGRKLTTSDAASEFEAAREEAQEVLPATEGVENVAPPVPAADEVAVPDIASSAGAEEVAAEEVAAGEAAEVEASAEPAEAVVEAEVEADVEAVVEAVVEAEGEAEAKDAEGGDA
ncbi:MAG TPA: 30S ribosomal protein S3 [Acidimicrobiia bacterium]|nr:30S ribosomal protein S3 [Acidimicrobiia bacterium]